MTARPWTPPLILLLCILVVLERIAAHGTSPVRTVLTVAFFVLAPGLAVVGLLRLADPWLAAALAPALSLSIGAIVGGILSYAGAWSATAGLEILVVISVLGALAQELMAYRRSAR
jgi:uncharacterized membrane protein